MILNVPAMWIQPRLTLTCQHPGLPKPVGASRLLVPMGSERGLHVELAFPAPEKAPPTTAENEKDFEMKQMHQRNPAYERR